MRLVPALVIVAALHAVPSMAGNPVFQRELDSITIFDSQGVAERPWFGGWEGPRPQLSDVDRDGDLDLFVAEEAGRLRFYRNAGTPASPSFQFETDDYAGIHDLYFVRVYDVDRDGDDDILVQAPEFIRIVGEFEVREIGAYLYTNTGTPQNPVYQNLSNHPDGYLVNDLGDPIAFLTTSPDFVDMDRDGDTDLMMGTPAGNVILYRNIGTVSSPVFHLESNAYQSIQIIFGSCAGGGLASGGGELVKAPLGDPPGQRAADQRHGFMLFSFFDIDNDTYPDLFVGDQFNSNVYYYRHDGNTPDANFNCVSQQFFPGPGGSTGVFQSYLVSTFGDLDGDSDNDAMIGAGTRGGEGVYYFENDGGLQQVTDNFLPEFDRGRESVPSFADWDDDGDLDLILGMADAVALEFYENVGTPQMPEFALLDPNWLPVPGAAWRAPEVADIDGDDDLDLFVGVSTGAVLFFRNDGSTSMPPTLTEVTTDDDFGDSFSRTFRANVDDQPVPRFFDYDGDGDLDALLGNWNFSGSASLRYFRNDGTPSAHDFVLDTLDFGGFGVLGQNLAPVFGDVNGDDQVDLLVGRQDGTIAYFQGSGGASATWTEVTQEFEGIDVGATSAPALADLDADGDLDLVVGESGGGLNLYRNLEVNCGTPSAFALTSPAAGASAPFESPTTFDWAPSLVAATTEVPEYEIRFAPRPTDPPSSWRTVDGITTSEVTLSPADHGAEHYLALVWSVVAKGPCGEQFVSPWRALVRGDAPVTEHPFDDDRPRILGLSPNPAVRSTSLSYHLPSGATVRVRVYDLAGRLVRTLQEGWVEEGEHALTWNGRTATGAEAGAGIYFIRAELADRVETRRVVWVR